MFAIQAVLDFRVLLSITFAVDGRITIARLASCLSNVFSMYYDLNIAWPVRVPPASSGQAGATGGSKKMKGKQATANAKDEKASVKVGLEALTAGEKQDLEKSVKMAIKRERVQPLMLLLLLSYHVHFVATRCPHLQSATLQ